MNKQYQQFQFNPILFDENLCKETYNFQLNENLLSAQVAKYLYLCRK